MKRTTNAMAAIASLAVASAVAPWTLSAAYTEQDGYVLLLGANSGNRGESTFVTNIAASAYGWSDLRDPHSDADYYCGYQLCTPKVSNGDFTFAGKSLTIAAAFRFLETSSVCVDDLRVEGGGWLQTAHLLYDVILKGNMTVLAGRGNPMRVEHAGWSQHYKIESKVSGGPDAFMRLYVQEGTAVRSQYAEFDDVVGYYGTMSVTNGATLKLASGMPGTIELAPDGRLETLAEISVANLDANGGTIRLVEGNTLHVTNALSVSGQVVLDVFASRTGAWPALTFPAGKGPLDGSAFLPASADYRMELKTAGGIQTLYVERLRCAKFDGTTGYVTTTTPAVLNPFQEPGAWDDGRIPHDDTNYYTEVGLHFTTNSVFGGRSLTSWNSNVRAVKQHITIGDWRVMGGNQLANNVLTTAGNDGRTYIHGGMTVLSRATDPYPFMFWGSLKNGQCWTSDQTIRGDAGSGFWVYNSLDEGTVSNAVELLGDTSGFLGRCFVSKNETLFLGGYPFGGEIVLTAASAHLDLLAAAGAVTPVARLTTQLSVSIGTPAMNTLAVETLSVTNALTKNGEGLLVVSRTRDCGTGASLRIAAGGLRTTAKDALDGLNVIFADGAAIHADFATTDADVAALGMYSAAGVVAEGDVEVVIDHFTDKEGVLVMTIPFLTVPAANGDGLRGHFRLRHPASGFRMKVVDGTQDGMTTFSVKMTRAGFEMILR